METDISFYRGELDEHHNDAPLLGRLQSLVYFSARR